MRKWISNRSEIIKEVIDTGDNKVLTIDENEAIKTLGLQWEPFKDEFKFKVHCDKDEKINKRVVLSTLAKIYDQPGWLAPVTVIGKLFMQKLWLAEQNWDQELSDLYRTFPISILLNVFK